MVNWKLMVLILVIAMITACGDPKPPVSNTDSTTTDAYGTDQSNPYGETDEEGINVTDMDVPEEPVLYDTEMLDTEGMETVPLDRDRLNLEWEPIYFEFDKATLTQEARAVLNERAKTMNQNPELVVLLEGHCDIRGTEEYNMALGERRAQQVKIYLGNLGVPLARIKTISYGELRPFIDEENEEAYSKNRRVEFRF